jgi:excisionase family DNA binding protein
MDFAAAGGVTLGALRSPGMAGGPMIRLYTIREAAELLNVPFTWLRDKVTARQVPHTRLGRHVRFTEAHLAKIVAEGDRPVVAAAPVAPTGRRRRRRAS